MNSPNKSPPCRRHTWLSLARKSLMPCGKSTRTPGICPGAELPFELLLEKEIRGHVRVFSSYIGKVGHVFGW